MSFHLPNIFIPINAYVTDSLLIYSQHTVIENDAEGKKGSDDMGNELERKQAREIESESE